MLLLRIDKCFAKRESIGGPSGGATLVKPQQDFDNRDLPVYFSRVAPSTTRKPTRAIPTATGTGNHGSGLSGGKRTGVIVGCILGGLILLAILLGVALCLLRRKKRERKSTASAAPSELPTNVTHEMNAESKYHPGSISGQQSIPQTYFYSPGSGHFTAPLDSPGSQPAELHAGPAPEYGHTTPYRDGSFHSNNPGQQPPGVYPRGPSYGEQNTQPQVPSPGSVQSSYRDAGQSYSQEGRQRSVPSPGDYSDAAVDHHRSHSNTPSQFYNQQSEFNQSPATNIGTTGVNVERTSPTFQNTRRGQSKFFEARS
jgi:hypothetical protein